MPEVSVGGAWRGESGGTGAGGDGDAAALDLPAAAMGIDHQDTDGGAAALGHDAWQPPTRLTVDQHRLTSISRGRLNHLATLSGRLLRPRSRMATDVLGWLNNLHNLFRQNL